MKLGGGEFENLEKFWGGVWRLGDWDIVTLGHCDIGTFWHWEIWKFRNWELGNLEIRTNDHCPRQPRNGATSGFVGPCGANDPSGLRGFRGPSCTGGLGMFSTLFPNLSISQCPNVQMSKCPNVQTSKRPTFHVHRIPKFQIPPISKFPNFPNFQFQKFLI